MITQPTYLCVKPLNRKEKQDKELKEKRIGRSMVMAKYKKTFNKVNTIYLELFNKKHLETNFLAVVVAQLVVQLIPTPQFHGSNPVVSKIYIEHLFTVNCMEITKIKKKEAGNVGFKKPNFQHFSFLCIRSNQLR